MSRLDLTQALARADAFKDLGRPVPKGTRFRFIKKIEARLTAPLLFRQRKYNAAVVDALGHIVTGLDNRGGATEVSRAVYQQHHEGIAALRRDLVALQQQLAEAERRGAERLVAETLAAAQVDSFVREMRRALPDRPDPAQLAASVPSAWDSLQNAFQDKLRGAFDVVADRLRVYLDDLPSNTDAAAPVLDLGCGRGEWLELLRGKGIPAYGVDSGETVVARAVERGLDVRQEDGLAHLRGLAPRSLSAVCAFHLVEHLPIDAVLELIDLSLRALRPGGRLILETPNPANVAVGASGFWLDPTHRHPLPSQLLAFVVAIRGFNDVEVRPLRRAVEPLAAPAGDADPHGRLGAVVELLNTHFAAGEDYAVLATRL